MRIEYFEVWRDAGPIDQPTRETIACLTDKGAAEQLHAGTPGSFLTPRVLLLDEYDLGAHTEVVMAVPVRNGQAAPEEASSQCRVVPREVARDVTTVLAVANRWTRPTAIIATGPDEESCAAAIAERIRDGLYEPPPKPGHYAFGEDVAPDTTKKHAARPRARAIPTIQVTSQNPSDVADPRRSPLRAIPPPSAFARQAEHTRPPAPKAGPFRPATPSPAVLLEHAANAGVEAMPCGRCGTVFYLGGNRQPIEYRIAGAFEDAIHDSGPDHTAERCDQVRLG